MPTRVHGVTAHPTEARLTFIRQSISAFVQARDAAASHDAPGGGPRHYGSLADPAVFSDLQSAIGVADAVHLYMNPSSGMAPLLSAPMRALGNRIIAWGAQARRLSDDYMAGRRDHAARCIPQEHVFMSGLGAAPAASICTPEVAAKFAEYYQAFVAAQSAAGTHPGPSGGKPHANKIDVKVVQQAQRALKLAALCAPFQSCADATVAARARTMATKGESLRRRLKTYKITRRACKRQCGAMGTEGMIEHPAWWHWAALAFLGGMVTGRYVRLA